eukprot:PhM_4_TR16373/c0_g1_i1/m.77380
MSRRAIMLVAMVTMGVFLWSVVVLHMALNQATNLSSTASRGVSGSTTDRPAAINTPPALRVVPGAVKALGAVVEALRQRLSTVHDQLQTVHVEHQAKGQQLAKLRSADCGSEEPTAVTAEAPKASTHHLSGPLRGLPVLVLFPKSVQASNETASRLHTYVSGLLLTLSPAAAEFRIIIAHEGWGAATMQLVDAFKPEDVGHIIYDASSRENIGISSPNFEGFAMAELFGHTNASGVVVVTPDAYSKPSGDSATRQARLLHFFYTAERYFALDKSVVCAAGAPTSSFVCPPKSDVPLLLRTESYPVGEYGISEVLISRSGWDRASRGKLDRVELPRLFVDYLRNAKNEHCIAACFPPSGGMAESAATTWDDAFTQVELETYRSNVRKEVGARGARGVAYYTTLGQLETVLKSNGVRLVEDLGGTQNGLPLYTFDGVLRLDVVPTTGNGNATHRLILVNKLRYTLSL